MVFYLEKFVFAIVFGKLRLLTSFLGPSWRFLACVDPKMAPKMDPKRDRKSENNCPKNVLLLNPTFSSFGDIVGAILGQKKRRAEKFVNQRSPHRPAKRLKNMKLSSKAVFSLQELPKYFENANTKTNEKREMVAQISFDDF